MYFEELQAEQLDRLESATRIRPYCVSFLDDALLGIGPGDLVLIAAATGSGKTELATHIALNARCRVLFYALEAEKWEIHRRLVYREMTALVRTHLGDRIKLPRFIEWIRGRDPDLLKLEKHAHQELVKKALQVKIIYPEKQMSVDEWCDQIDSEYGQDADLLIVDHLHYFRLGDRESEMSGFKRVISTIRHRALALKKPVILLAHFNKNSQSAKYPGLEGVHGHSDLVKVATHVITLAPAEHTGAGKWPTNFRIAKSRTAGEVKRYVATHGFDVKNNQYTQRYHLQLLTDDGVEAIAPTQLPEWAVNASRGAYADATR